MEVLACRGLNSPDSGRLSFALDSKLPSYDVMKKMKPVAVTDISRDYPDFKIHVNQEDYEEIGSWAGIPLISKGVAIGLIALDRIKKEPFANEEIQLVTAVAGQAGLAIENARLFGEANQHLKRLTSLRDIDKAISSSFDLHLSLNVLLEQVCSQLDVDAAVS
jgi:GAF domain-containing protein